MNKIKLKNKEYYERRINFVARQFLHGELTFNESVKNRDKLLRLKYGYLETSNKKNADSYSLTILNKILDII